MYRETHLAISSLTGRVTASFLAIMAVAGFWLAFRVAIAPAMVSIVLLLMLAILATARTTIAVDERGIRIRRLLGGRFLPWEEIRAMHDAPPLHAENRIRMIGTAPGDYFAGTTKLWNVSAPRAVEIQTGTVRIFFGVKSAESVKAMRQHLGAGKGASSNESDSITPSWGPVSP